MPFYLRGFLRWHDTCSSLQTKECYWVRFMCLLFQVNSLVTISLAYCSDTFEDHDLYSHCSFFTFNISFYGNTNVCSSFISSKFKSFSNSMWVGIFFKVTSRIVKKIYFFFFLSFIFYELLFWILITIENVIHRHRFSCLYFVLLWNKFNYVKLCLEELRICYNYSMSWLIELLWWQFFFSCC